jgi:hypothetical protein
MARSKLQVFREYRYGPRSILTPGDRFRVSGGPVYVTDDGKTLAMFDRGVFVFERYCVRGSSKWIEAYRAEGGIVILWVGRSGRSPAIPNYRRRPYRIRGKLRERSVR